MTTEDLTPEVTRLLSLAAVSLRSDAARRFVRVLADMDPVQLAAGVRQMDLAASADITDRSVRRILRRLEALGVVEYVRLGGNRRGYKVDAERLAIVVRALS